MAVSSEWAWAVLFVSSISSDLAYTAHPFDAAVAMDLSPESLNVAFFTLNAPQVK